jgi:hypothetical protein
MTPWPRWGGAGLRPGEGATRPGSRPLLRVATTLSLGCFALGSSLGGQTLPRVLSWEAAVRGNGELELRQPVALAAGASDELLVADAHGPRLLLVRFDGLEWVVTRALTLPAPPIGLAHDGSGYLLSLRGLGLMAVEPGDRLRPVALPAGIIPGTVAAVSGGGFLVHDLAGERVLRLSRGGEVATEVVKVGRISALAATSDGGLVVARAEEGALQRYGASGALTATWRIPGDGPVPAWPQAVAVEPGGGLLVLDRHNGRVVALDATGRPVGLGSRHGWEPGLLRFPAALTRLPDGRVVVADQGNGRVQIFTRAQGQAP